jgi:hypothetical protein
MKEAAAAEVAASFFVSGGFKALTRFVLKFSTGDD